MNEPERITVDVVVIGAGLVGTSLVVGLQQAGLQVAVLEKHLPTIIEPGDTDHRPISLAYGSVQCLQRWGVWSALAPQAKPIEQLHVSEQGRLGRVVFSAKDYQLPALAYVVPFALLQQQLYQQARAQAETQFIAIDDIHHIECHETGVTIDYSAADKPMQLKAQLLIAADGTNSRCRQLLKIDADQKDAGDRALIIKLSADTASHHQAYQRFTRRGSLALLPLIAERQHRLVWSMSAAVFDEVKPWSDERLSQHILTAFGGRLDNISHVQRDGSYPLQTLLAKETVGPGRVLLGNAAHTIYPLAAQGFNLGLQDADQLAKTITRAQQQGQAIGAMATLNHYSSRRKNNQDAVIDWTQRIASAFRWRLPGVDHVRGMALLGLDMLPPVKAAFARNFLHG